MNKINVRYHEMTFQKSIETLFDKEKENVLIMFDKTYHSLANSDVK